VVYEMQMKRFDQKRDILVYELRSSGKTFREIGFVIGVCAARARQIYLRWERILAIRKRIEEDKVRALKLYESFRK